MRTSGRVKKDKEKMMAEWREKRKGNKMETQNNGKIK